MIIQGNRVFIAGQFMQAQIKIEGSKIKAVLPYGTEKEDADYKDMMVVPGFIDVHTHGAYGYSVEEGTPEGMKIWMSKLPEEGVTSFLPTTATNKKEATIAALKNIADVKEKKPSGAQIIGVHLEGPFLDSTFRGAHEPKLLRKPTVDDFKEFQEASGGNICYMTVACEHDEDYALIRYASRNGVTVSIGHSGASLEKALLAVANGASSFTHSFNGMRGIHHREPGVVGALMTSNAFAEIIPEGYHVHPNAINMLFKAKNNTRIILITDSLFAKGMPKGVYELGNDKVEMDENGTARLFGTNTIAGSSLKVNLGIKLLVQKAMVSIEHAILSATFYPAQALGLEKQKGQILAGNDADLTVLDDEWNVKQTYCLGKAML